MGVENRTAIAAMGTVLAAGPTLQGGAGVSSVVAHPGVGRYRLTLDAGVDLSEGAFLATPRTANNDDTCTTLPIDDVTIEVRTRRAGALSDVPNFDFLFLRFPSK